MTDDNPLEYKFLPVKFEDPLQNRKAIAILVNEETK